MIDCIVLPALDPSFRGLRRLSMSQVLFEIVVILLLIAANGVFAMSEIAIVSSRKARLEKWAAAGDSKAREALVLAKQPNTFLSTLQVGMSGTAILAGVFGGATVAQGLSAFLGTIQALRPYSQAISMSFVVLTITYLTLVLGELVPKRIALINAEKIACLVAGPMMNLSRMTRFMVEILSKSTEFVLNMIGIKQLDEPFMTSDEIKMIFDQGAQAGVFAASESDLVKSVLHLGKKSVTTLMTPRSDIIWLSLDDQEEKVLSTLVKAIPTRILVVQDNIDNVQGYVVVKAVLAQPLVASPVDLKACLEKPLFVPETKSALEVLELFKKAGVHIAVVLDEFGSTLGLVTMTDLLKAIVGEMQMSGLQSGARAIECGDGSWLLDGRLTIDQLKAILRLDRLPDEEKAHFQTVSGFLLHQLGHVPAVADYLEWNGYIFTVVSMNGKRINKIALNQAKR